MPSRPVRPPSGDDQIAVAAAALWTAIDRDQADGAAVDQRIAQVALVEADRAIDRGDAHAVAVIAHAGDDAFQHLEGMQHARRQRLRRRVRRREAEHVGVADRLRSQAGAERIADDAAQARVRAAVGLDGRRVIVRLDLEADVITVVEAHDAGVVGEDADAPVVGAEPAADLLRRPEDRLLEQIVEMPDAAVVFDELDTALEGLVRAMLRPRLRQRLQLHVGRIAAQLAEMRLDGPHLGETE